MPGCLRIPTSVRAKHSFPSPRGELTWKLACTNALRCRSLKNLWCILFTICLRERLRQERPIEQDGRRRFSLRLSDSPPLQVSLPPVSAFEKNGDCLAVGKEIRRSQDEVRELDGDRKLDRGE